VHKIHVQFSLRNRKLTHALSVQMVNSEMEWEERLTNARQLARMDVRLVLTQVWQNVLHANKVW
jgi:hypothetical protein